MIRPLRCFSIGLRTAWLQTNARRQVRRDHLVPVVALHPQHQLIARDAGVVDQDVDPAVTREHAGDHRVDRSRVGDLQRRDLGLPPRRLDLGHRRRRVVATRRGATTCAPREASIAATVRPMPRDAPVTIATLPVSWNMESRKVHVSSKLEKLNFALTLHFAL